MNLVVKSFNLISYCPFYKGTKRFFINLRGSLAGNVVGIVQFIRCRKVNISLVFITRSYFPVPEDVRLNSTHYLVMKINNRKDLQNIAINHSGDIGYNNFVRIYRDRTRKLHSFLTIPTMFPARDPLRFMKNLLVPL